MDKRAKILLSNWQDEKEAVMHYSFMARREAIGKKKTIYNKLADIEEKHAQFWEKELKKCGITPSFNPSIKARIISLIGKIFGHKSLISTLEKSETSAVGGYAKQIDMFDDNIMQELKKIIPEEKRHSRMLNEVSSKPTDPLAGERWHRGGGSIRDIIFGMNDKYLV